MLDITGGCAFYGHSCYGGHGKRSDMAPSALNSNDEPPSINSLNKEFPVKTILLFSSKTICH